MSTPKQRLRSQRGHYRAVVAALILFLGLAMSDASATTLRKLSLDDLVAKADSIIVGECVNTRAVWLGRRIYTIATMRVDQSLKGSERVGNKVEVFTLGGRVKKPIPVKMHAPGLPRFERNEEVMVFLKRRETSGAKGPGDNGPFVVIGGIQGKFTIQKDAKTGEKRLRRPLAGKGPLRKVLPEGPAKEDRKPGVKPQPAVAIDDIEKIGRKEPALENVQRYIQGLVHEQAKAHKKRQNEPK